MNKISQKNWLKTIITFLILLIGFSISYSLFLKDFLNKQEERKCFQNAEKGLVVSKKNIDTEKERIIEEKYSLIIKKPKVLEELDQLSKEIEENEFKKNEEQISIIEKITEEDFRRQQELKIKMSHFNFGSLYNDSKETIRRKIYNQRKDQFLKNHSIFKAKDEESQGIDSKIKEIENNLLSLDNNIEIAERKYNEDKVFCLKRY